MNNLFIFGTSKYELNLNQLIVRLIMVVDKLKTEIFLKIMKLINHVSG